MPTTATFYPAYDGHLQKYDGSSYEAAQAAASSPVTSVSYLDVGQWQTAGGAFYLWRSYLSFDTSSIPDDATIISATLSLTTRQKNDDTGFTLSGKVTNWSPTLADADWTVGPVATFTKASSEFAAAGSATQISIPIASVSLTGRTDLELWSDREGSSPSGEEYLMFYSVEGTTTAYRPTLTVVYSSPPTTPTGLSPAEGFDATGAKQFSATYHDPDSDAMSAYQIEVYDNATSALEQDTGWVIATNLTHTFPAATFANGTTYKWRVRTKDSYGLEGAWSDYVVFTCGVMPSVTVTSPTASELKTTRTFTATHSYSSTASLDQSKYQYVFKVGGETILDSGEITGQGTSYVAVLPQDGTYTLEVTVWDTDTVSNTSAAVTFTVNTTSPHAPTITTVFTEATASVTASVTNPVAWETSATEPSYTGTGNGTISQPTATDGETLTGTWTAEHVTLADVYVLSIGGVMAKLATYACFDVKVDDVHVGYAAIGVSFTYNGSTFTITQGATPFVDGDIFTWDTFAHTVDYNQIWRRVTGTVNWTLIKDNLTPGSPATFTDYTVASDQDYEFGATAVDVFGNVSAVTVATSIAVDFDNYWIVDQENATVFQMAGGDRIGKFTSERERQEYKPKDETYPSVVYSTDKFYRGSFQFILLPETGTRIPDRLATLRALADADTKEPLIFKTFSGDVYYCDIYDFSFEIAANNDFGRVVSFELVEVGDPEDIFPQ